MLQGAIPMFMICPFHRMILCLLTRTGVPLVAILIFSASSVFAFQSFEEFSRSKNHKYNVDVVLFTNPETAKPGEGFDLYLDIKLSRGWHLYALEPQGRDKTLATQIQFNENVFQPEGRWLEPKPVIILDGALNRVVKVHENAVRFSRRLSVPDHLKSGAYPISGAIEFRACDNKICSLPRKVGFKAQFRVLAGHEAF